MLNRRPENDGMFGGPLAREVVAPMPARLVKSGMRALEILEYFTTVRRPAIALEISTALGLPVSSGNELLKSLEEAGFLVFDPREKTYFPSPRVTRLSSAALPATAEAQVFQGLLADLQARTGACVTLSAQNRHLMQFVAFLASPGVGLDGPQEGLKYPMVGTASGGAIFAVKSRDELLGLICKGCVGLSPAARERTTSLVLSQVRAAHERGYAVSFGDLPRNSVSIAVSLWAGATHVPLALCLGGASSRYAGHEGELASLARDTLATHNARNGGFYRIQATVAR